jgi:hypothetical protein
MPSADRRTVVLAAAVPTALLLGVLVLGAGGGDESSRFETVSTTGTSVVADDRDRSAPRLQGSATDGSAGAIEAAVVAASAPQRWLYADEETITAEVLAMSTTEAGRALADLTVSDLRTAREDLSLSPGPVWWIVHPLATRVASITSTAAEIEVWTVTVLSAVEIAAPQTEWLTVTVDLHHDGDRWLVEAIRDRPGPTPALGPGDDPWDAAPLADRLDGFVRLDGSESGPTPS